MINLILCLKSFYTLRSYIYYQELGLVSGTPVGTSLIDAHAGGVGVMESVPVTDPGSTGYLSFVCSLTKILILI